MPDVTVRSSGSTLNRLKELAANMEFLLSKEQSTNVHVKVGFATPLAVVPLAAIINERKLHLEGEQNTYLETIHFPEGVKEVKMSRKTYLPIIRLQLASLPPSEVGTQLNKLSAVFLDLLRSNVIADREFIEMVTVNAFGFLLEELMDNVAEHAEARNVYVFSQYWPKTNSCELCILDDGQGLFGSLRAAGRDVSDSLDAIRKVLNQGLSAKDEFGDIHRGTGLRNTRAVIANRDISGEFLILSGNAAYWQSSSSGERFVQLSKTEWNGTIVMLQLRKPVTPFNLYSYVR